MSHQGWRTDSPEHTADPTLGSREMIRFGDEQGARVKGIVAGNTCRVEQKGIYLSWDSWKIVLLESCVAGSRHGVVTSHVASVVALP